MTKRLRFVDDFIANKRIARTSLDRRALVDLKEAIEENVSLLLLVFLVFINIFQCDELTVSRRAIKVFEVGLSDTFLKEYGDMQNQALRRSEEVYSLEISNKQVHSLLISDQVKWRISGLSSQSVLRKWSGHLYILSHASKDFTVQCTIRKNPGKFSNSVYYVLQ